jgi:hypothetical protein
MSCEPTQRTGFKHGETISPSTWTAAKALVECAKALCDLGKLGGEFPFRCAPIVDNEGLAIVVGLG